MSSFDLGEVMKDIVSGLITATQSMKIIGEPVEAAGKVVIPAVIARVGFGAGGGSGQSKSDEAAATDEADHGPGGEGAGGGGGGCAMMTPVFLVIDEQGERLLTVPGPFSFVGSTMEKAKKAFDRIMPRRDDDE